MAYAKSVTVDVTVDLSDFDEEDLVEHLQACGYAVLESGGEGFEVDDLQRIRDAVVENRIADALALLDRIISPKWPSLTACQSALELAKNPSSERTQ
jgi:hypothetical protein